MDLLPAYTHINDIISRKISEINYNRPWIDDSNYWQWQDDADMIIEVLRELEHEIFMTREIFPKSKKYKIIWQDASDLLSYELEDDNWEKIYADIFTGSSIPFPEFDALSEEFYTDTNWRLIHNGYAEALKSLVWMEIIGRPRAHKYFLMEWTLCENTKI